MNVKDLYKKINELLPVKWEENNKVKDYKNLLSDTLKKFCDIIKDLDDAAKPEHWENIIEVVKKLKIKIIDIISKEYDGAHSTAFSGLKNILQGSKKLKIKIKDNFQYYTLEKDTKTYRIRMYNFGERKAVKYKDMFHIPLNMRGIVKTERYSMSGYPCLYLGLSSYGCWEEMGQPAINTCMVSCIENTEDVKLLDLRIPAEAVFSKQLSDYLIIYPLIISCMVQVKNSGDIYKPEYIIPQLIIEWLINNSNNNKTNDKLLGVIYTSVEKNKRYGFPDKVFDNLAIPAVIGSKKEEYSSELCRIFRITNPTCYEFEEIRMSSTNKPKKGLTVDENKYKSSLFGKLEDALSDRTIFPLKNMDCVKKDF